MKTTMHSLVAVGWCLASLGAAPGQDPLPSWNDGPAKSAIIDFVRKTTTEGSPDFVPLADRIAVFDNDGTLWPENPLPFEVAFALDTAKAAIEKRPELKDKPAYKALASGDIAALTDDHMKNLFQACLIDVTGRACTVFFQRLWMTHRGNRAYPRVRLHLSTAPGFNRRNRESMLIPQVIRP